MKPRLGYVVFGALMLLAGAFAFSRSAGKGSAGSGTSFDDLITQNAARMVGQGRHTFRFDTFGDEKFWGDTLLLHQAVEGKKFGGVGAGVSPRTALGLGLKVDVNALPDDLVAKLKQGRVNLDDPAVTLKLLQLNAVVGLTGFFNPPAQHKAKGGAQVPGHPMFPLPLHRR